MKILKMLFRKAAHSAVRSPHVRGAIRVLHEEAAMLEHQHRPTLQVFDTFADRYGHQHELFQGLRDSIKPGWQIQLAEGEKAHLPTTSEIAAAVKPAMASVREVKQFLEDAGISFFGKRVLETGCYDGLRCEALAHLGAGSVTGGDITRYFIMQKSGVDLNKESEAKQNEQFGWIRSEVGRAFTAQLGPRPHGTRIEYLEDNITQSALPAESHDFIFSWEVLEHVINPAKGMKEMARILKPGGYAFHDYNPFFSYNGGHSLCTLDFRWGHARLSEDDFERYVQRFRPNEVRLAMQFYRENLNRMTYSHLKKHIADAGLELVAFLPWAERRMLKWMTGDVFSQVNRAYPDTRPEDLAAQNVWVVTRKPE